MGTSIPERPTIHLEGFPQGFEGDLGLAETLTVSDSELHAAKTQDVILPFAAGSEGSALQGTYTLRAKEDGTYTARFSLDTASPALSNKEGVPGIVNNDSWFGGFLVVFTMLIDQISNVQKTIKKMEKEMEIDNRKSLMEQTKDKAKLTISLAELQSQEKRLEAIGQFMDAGVSAFNAGSHIRNKRQAESEYSGKNSKMEHEEAKLKTADKKIKELETSKGKGAVADKNLEDSITEAKAERNEIKHQLGELRADQQYKINSRTASLDEASKNAVNCMHSAVKSWMTFTVSLIKTQEGAIQAAKEIADGNMQQMQKNLENSSSAYSAATQFLDSLWQCLQKYQDTHANSRG